MVEIDDGGRVLSTIDKPAQTDLRLMWGACCWSPRFTALLGEFVDGTEFAGKELVLGDVFDLALERGMNVVGLPFEDGKYIDIGTTDELNAALKQFNL